MAGDENPFKKALQEASDAGPAPAAVEGQVSLVKQQQMRTVADLNLVAPALLERMPAIRDLTVRDLNDLAAEFAGIKTDNRRVAELSLEDVQDIEQVFFDFKVNTGRELIRGGAGTNLVSGTDVDVSCCCCTPCCCCAATDMSHAA